MLALRIAALAMVASVSIALPRLTSAQEATAEGLDDGPDVQYDVFWKTVGRYQVDNGDRTTREDGDQWDPTGENFGEWNNLFGGSISYGAFQLTVQGDAVTYIHPPRAAPDARPLVRNELLSRYENVLSLEFVSLSYSDRDMDITLGDFYVTLGRGMLLAIRKVADVGIDNKLRGLEYRARIGPVTAHVFAGFLNIRNYEVGRANFYPESIPGSDCSEVETALAICADGIDWIAGARLEYRLGKYLKLGGHGAVIDAPSSADSDLRGVGATIELPRPVKWLNAYFEGVVLERDRPSLGPKEVESGRGVYGNVNLFFGKTTLLIEGKAYDNLFNVTPRGYSTPQPGTTAEVTQIANQQVINRILEPPTAERPFTRILANNTVYGARIRADYRVTRKFVPFLSGGYFRDTSNDIPTNIFFGVGGFRLYWKGGEAMLNAGYRAQLLDLNTSAAMNQVAAAQVAFQEAAAQAQAVAASPDATPEQREAAARNLDSATSDLSGAVVELQRTEVRDNQAFRNDAHIRFDVSFNVGGPYSLEFFGDTFYVVEDRPAVDCQVSPEFEGCDGVDLVQTRFALNPDEWLEGRLSVSLRSEDGWSLTAAYEFFTQRPENTAVHYPSLSGQWDFTEGGTLRFLVGGERAGLKCSGGVCRFFPGFEGGRLELSLRY